MCESGWSRPPVCRVEARRAGAASESRSGPRAGRQPHPSVGPDCLPYREFSRAGCLPAGWRVIRNHTFGPSGPGALRRLPARHRAVPSMRSVKLSTLRILWTACQNCIEFGRSPASPALPENNLHEIHRALHGTSRRLTKLPPQQRLRLAWAIVSNRTCSAGSELASEWQGKVSGINRGYGRSNRGVLVPSTRFGFTNPLEV